MPCPGAVSPCRWKAGGGRLGLGREESVCGERKRSNTGVWGRSHKCVADLDTEQRVSVVGCNLHLNKVNKMDLGHDLHRWRAPNRLGLNRACGACTVLRPPDAEVSSACVTQRLFQGSVSELCPLSGRPANPACPQRTPHLPMQSSH